MTSRRPTLDDVLEELQSSVAAPDARTAKDWSARHPEYADDILLFVNEWIYQTHSTAKPGRLNEGMARSRASSDLALRLDKFRAKVKPAGIVATVKASSISIETVASHLHCNVKLLDMLDNKQVQLSTIPDSFIDALAKGTHEPVEWIVGCIAAARRPGHSTVFVRGVLGPDDGESAKTFAEAWIESGLSQRDLEGWMK